MRGWRLGMMKLSQGKSLNNFKKDKIGQSQFFQFTPLALPLIHKWQCVFILYKDLLRSFNNILISMNVFCFRNQSICHFFLLFLVKIYGLEDRKCIMFPGAESRYEFSEPRNVRLVLHFGIQP